MEDLVLTSLWLGFALRLTHALDPDHLVAVETMAVESESIRRLSAFGIFWGMGHTMALALVSGVVLTLKWTIPEFLATGMEAIIAMMIIFLGGSLVWHAAQSLTVHSHAHTHGDTPHAIFIFTQGARKSITLISLDLGTRPLRWEWSMEWQGVRC